VPSALNLAIRSYAQAGAPHHHDFAQLVLPLQGVLEIEIEGRGARLDTRQAAFVTPGARHDQEGRRGNRALVVDLDPLSLPSDADRFTSRPFLHITPAAGRLIDYMALSMAEADASLRGLDHWTPLLLDALLTDAPKPRSRLVALRQAVEADLSRPWTAADMAAQVGMSVSRLHVLFRAELDTAPAAWLSDLRLTWVREQLAASERPVADLALLAGYSDQNALTRAMRRVLGQTPAAYRRHIREAGPRLR